MLRYVAAVLIVATTWGATAAVVICAPASPWFLLIPAGLLASGIRGRTKPAAGGTKGGGHDQA